MIFEVVDMMEMRFPESHFDAIISYYSIIYTPKEYLNKLFSNFNKILKPKGKILIVVKKGDHEGFFEDDEWYKSTIYYSFFNENDIRTLLENNGFTIELLKTRNPYEYEIQCDRIYSIGVKSKI